jgi:hypothetical protein
MIGMTVLVKALVALLWLVNFAQGFVVPTPRRSFGSSCGGGGGSGGIRPPRRLVVSQQQSTLLSLADFDTMTLNWIGLAVGTMASLWVYQNDQNQEGESTSPSQPVMASSSTTLAPSKPVAAPKKETTTTVAVAKPPVVPAKTTTKIEAPPKPVVAAPVATKVMKETQKGINQKLQQVADKMQTTTQPEAPVFTEPYSDKVKLSVKRKSRFVGKLTKKVFMPWKAWSDL